MSIPCLWEYIQKFPDWVDNEINNNKYSLRNNTKGYGSKTHWTDSQNSNTTAPSGRELYHLQFLLQVASSETLLFHTKTMYIYTLLTYKLPVTFNIFN
jgi:hypothetical protein